MHNYDDKDLAIVSLLLIAIGLIVANVVTPGDTLGDVKMIVGSIAGLATGRILK